MKIEFVLYASLTQFVSGSVAGKPITLEIPDKATVNHVLHMMAIPSDMALILLINGRSGTKEHELSEGDRLAIFPPIAGG
ncbi:MAG: MoaD/ThiS family protein [Deltaproteobacteria bacterium]|nr:MoaD/ThiS family protein [Deltaproteobacteria bacterium]